MLAPSENLTVLTAEAIRHLGQVIIEETEGVETEASPVTLPRDCN